MLVELGSRSGAFAYDAAKGVSCATVVPFYLPLPFGALFDSPF